MPGVPARQYCVGPDPTLMSITPRGCRGPHHEGLVPRGVFMKTAKDVLKHMKDNDVKYVDLRFTDPRGKWQHVTFDAGMIEEDTFSEGLMFDGSSIAGWKAINESDMCLMPDAVTATIDPFFAETTLILVCDVLEPTTGEPYNRDPRGIAKKAEAMV